MLPRWNQAEGSFSDGSVTIRQAFTRLVRLYGRISPGGGAVDKADASYNAVEDILGRRRPIGSAPDLGAVEIVRYLPGTVQLLLE